MCLRDFFPATAPTEGQLLFWNLMSSACPPTHPPMATLHGLCHPGEKGGQISRLRASPE